jgi:large subunit ribosomal protein L2
MGKRIRTQRRGAAKHRYTAPSHRFKTTASYREGEMRGVVTSLEKDPSKTSILMEIKWEDGTKTTYIAPEGICVNDEITQGGQKLETGNVMTLKNIPEGIPLFNVESKPGDGGKLVRSSGESASIVARQKNQVIVKLPSKRLVPLKPGCRATVGVASGGGRTERPLVKAGLKFYKKKARGHRYPTVRAVVMNPVAHPHGGTRHHVGHSSTVSRNTPPGRKVGHIAARRTGRKKRK